MTEALNCPLGTRRRPVPWIAGRTRIQNWPGPFGLETVVLERRYAMVLTTDLEPPSPFLGLLCRYSFFGIGGGVYSFHLPAKMALDGDFGSERGASLYA